MSAPLQKKNFFEPGAGADTPNLATLLESEPIMAGACHEQDKRRPNQGKIHSFGLEHHAVTPACLPSYKAWSARAMSCSTDSPSPHLRHAQCHGDRNRPLDRRAHPAPPCGPAVCSTHQRGLRQIGSGQHNQKALRPSEYTWSICRTVAPHRGQPATHCHRPRDHACR